MTVAYASRVPSLPPVCHSLGQARGSQALDAQTLYNDRPSLSSPDVALALYKVGHVVHCGPLRSVY